MWLSVCKYDIHVYPPPSLLYISSWLAVPYLEHTAALSHDRGEGEAEETARSKDITAELQTAFEDARLSLSRNQGQWPLGVCAAGMIVLLPHPPLQTTPL